MKSRLLREGWHRLLGVVWRHPADRELEEELRVHLEFAKEALNGTDDANARRAVLINSGGVAQAMEALRDQRGLTWLTDLFQDVRFGFRLLRRSPAVTGIVVLTLAIGIAANVVIFSAFSGIVLQTIHVNEPDTLVRFRWVGENSMGTSFGDYGFVSKVGGQRTQTTFSYPMFQLFRTTNQTLVDLLACAPIGQVPVLVNGRADVASGILASGNYFEVLGVHPMLGRTFEPADDRPNAQAVAVLSFNYWQSRLGGDPSAIGSVFTMGGIPVTVIGVTPRDFAGVQRVLAEGIDITVPLAMQPRLRPETNKNRPLLEQTTSWWLQIMGRLRPGVTPEQVAGELDGTFQAAAKEGWRSYFDSLPPDRQSLSTYQNRTHVPHLNISSGARGIYDVRDDTYRSLLVLGSVVILLLLTICANVTNLLLARAATRLREVSTRLAVGATSTRLVRQFLAESVVLAVLGGGAGFFLSYWGQRLLPLDLRPPSSLDWRVFGFLGGLTLLCALGFGTLPAVRGSSGARTSVLREGHRLVGGHSTLGQFLVILQVAVSFALIVEAGLFVRTIHNLRQVDVGFDARRLLLVSVDPHLNGYDRHRIDTLYERFLDEFSRVPGVQGVTWSDLPLLSGGIRTTDFFVQGRTQVPADKGQSGASLGQIYCLIVARNFFETMGLPLINGRGFTVKDDAAGPHVAMINQAAARAWFPGQNPIGVRAGNTFEKRSDFEIVGVVGDAKYNSVRDDAPPTLYIPYAQWTQISGVTFALRVHDDSLGTGSTIRSAAQRIDPDVPILNFGTQEDRIEQRFAQERVLTQAYLLFGGLALLVASVGLFGLMSYTVSRRTNEIGVRVALGAKARDVIGMVMRESMTLVGVGIAIGGLLAWAAAQLIAHLLFGVTPHDAITTIGAVVVMLGLSALAAYLPARRAARIDPMVALRCD